LRENIFDIAQDILKERLDAATGELKSQFKGTNPYRKKRLPDKKLGQMLRKDLGENMFERLGGYYG